MKIVKVHEAKTNLSAILADIEEHGNEYTIARAGKPIAQLIPLKQKTRQLGTADYQVPDSFFDPLDNAEIALWEQ